MTSEWEKECNAIRTIKNCDDKYSRAELCVGCINKHIHTLLQEQRKEFVEDVERIFKIRKGMSRPIKNKKGEITTICMVDMRDLSELIDKYHSLEEGKEDEKEKL